MRRNAMKWCATCAGPIGCTAPIVTTFRSRNAGSITVLNTGNATYVKRVTNTIFSGHHQPLCVWMLCLYLMGLNLSNRQITAELGVNRMISSKWPHNSAQALLRKRKSSWVAKSSLSIMFVSRQSTLACPCRNSRSSFKSIFSLSFCTPIKHV